MITNQKLTVNHVVVQAEGNIVSDMDGEKVMLNISRGKYYNLGEVGGRIWDGISAPISIRNLVPILMAEYNVEQSKCEDHVLSFLEQLLEEQLIYIEEEGMRQ
ncbi:lasso peptide biosynthesis PqqD family chaperone [Cohnella luojiensis]|uniref:Lasso peptide biosynthesis PqqD family chaperone n=1 Tax=Cohnella luojiensis TaxID=652876 RepID=A0A4Y8LPX4_9BACL|nr:lasso peptide biosynthesis PqqD family chaperone [Cohnella luojiensis]TFE22629.1 lasso peptide biosynthesis PqqD family chaperone [Cohnella luojiensis]